jgi:hypothetical protein
MRQSLLLLHVILSMKIKSEEPCEQCFTHQCGTISKFSQWYQSMSGEAPSSSAAGDEPSVSGQSAVSTGSAGASTASTAVVDVSQYIAWVDPTAPPLSIRPTDSIVFNVTEWEKGGKTEPRTYMYLTNKTNYYVLFKTRATHPRRYLAGPSSGVIPPGGEQVLKVILNPKEDLPDDPEKRAKAKERLVILSYPITSPTAPSPDPKFTPKIVRLNQEVCLC